MWVKISNTIAYGISLVSNLYIKLGKHQHNTPKRRQHTVYQIILAVTVFNPFNLESSSNNFYAVDIGRMKPSKTDSQIGSSSSVRSDKPYKCAWTELTILKVCIFSLNVGVGAMCGWWMLSSITIVC